jgi:hypothetical protein
MSRVVEFLRRYTGQVVAYIAFAALLGYFSANPDWTYFPDDRALIKLSLTHGGERREDCRERTKEERAKFPPTAKPPLVCPRERHPVTLTIWLDDKRIYHRTRQPMGLSRDGPSQFYQRFEVAPGRRQLKLEIADGGPGKAAYVQTQEIDLIARRVVVIEADHGKLKVR